MTPWAVLGVREDADLATVRRAYAALLKQHRPDSDPEGFRRIHDAYRALQMLLASRSGAAAHAPAGSDPVEAAASVGVAPPPAAQPAGGGSATTAAPEEAPTDRILRRPAATTAPPRPSADPEQPLRAARALVAGATAEALATAEQRAPVIAAIHWLQGQAPEALADLDPQVVGVLAAHGEHGLARWFWNAWEQRGQVERLSALAETWLRLGGDVIEDEAWLIVMAVQLAIVDAPLSRRLSQAAFRADPRLSEHRFAASGFDDRLAMGVECQDLDPAVRLGVQRLVSGTEEAPSPALVAELSRLPATGHVQRLLLANSPTVAAQVMLERELRRLSPAAEKRLRRAFTEGRWQAEPRDATYTEIVRRLGDAKFGSTLMTFVRARLPALAASVMGNKRVTAARRVRKRQGSTVAGAGFTVSGFLLLSLLVRGCWAHEAFGHAQPPPPQPRTIVPVEIAPPDPPAGSDEKEGVRGSDGHR